jgi:prepilin-type N-terminal cleavage/methylation domain-containing protein/prepilin-type processing-associated H-X9-DG protein
VLYLIAAQTVRELPREQLAADREVQARLSRRAGFVAIEGFSITGEQAMSRRIARQSGFTLVELLVSIAVTGVLAALLLPAVQSARASARRIQCGNQLRQLGLGLHLYHDAHACFPPGAYIMGPSFAIQSGWGWGAMIFPHIEENDFYQQLDFGQGTAVGTNLPLIATSVSIWRCPSEISPEIISASPSNTPPFNLATGNYCGSAGILNSMSRVKISDICDGTSKTLLAGERMDQLGLNGTLPFTSSWCGDVAFQDAYASTSVPYLTASRGHPLNASPFDPNCFGSYHMGGANFVLADGSLRFINDNISLSVYVALGTICKQDVVVWP